jgi:5-methylcytosine-specific restriction endonuclease McrA
MSTCSITDCDRKVHAKGLCGKHYRRELARRKRKEDPAGAEAERERVRRWKRENRSRVEDYNANWHREHRKEVRLRAERWREKNPDYHREWRMTNGDRVCEYYVRRRNNLRAASVEPVDPLKVFERDAWRCQICGGELRGRYPDLLSPSLDHIVPLVKGGEHSYANVQAAHFGCNSRKAARDMDEIHQERTLAALSVITC